MEKELVERNKCVIVKNVNSKFAFGELDDNSLIPVSRLSIIFEDETSKEYTLLMGVDEDVIDFMDFTSKAVEEMNAKFKGQKFDENEFYNILNKHSFVSTFNN